MSKYNNVKVVVDGELFDSKKEAARYFELKMLERAGTIKDLTRQFKFILIPAQYEGEGKNRRCIERECSYIADFVYLENGKLVAEDVKGYRDPSSAGYAKWVIKRKLMMYLHNIRVREI